MLRNPSRSTLRSAFVLSFLNMSTKDDEARKLIDKIATIIANQHHNFSEGEVRSLHKAMDWIGEANKKLNEKN